MNEKPVGSECEYKADLKSLGSDKNWCNIFHQRVIDENNPPCKQEIKENESNEYRVKDPGCDLSVYR